MRKFPTPKSDVLFPKVKKFYKEFTEKYNVIPTQKAIADNLKMSEALIYYYFCLWLKKGWIKKVKITNYDSRTRIEFVREI